MRFTTGDSSDEKIALVGFVTVTLFPIASAIPEQPTGPTFYPVDVLWNDEDDITVRSRSDR